MIPKTKAISEAKSGIGLYALAGDTTQRSKVATSFLTSRTARVLLAGAGFLADAYDLFVINLVLRLLRDEYAHYGKSGELHALEGAVASAALFGAIFGQIMAGFFADIVGRKIIFIGTAVLIIIGCIGGSLSIDNSMFSIYAQIACWRAILGMGVGGEYPLAATVTSESSSAGKRGTLMAAVFAMQGVGALLSVIVVLLCLWAGMSQGATWRFALAFGSAPAVLAFPWRLRMHETESFQRVKDARRDGHTHHSELRSAYRFYKWHMLGTASTWFLLDVVFYANGLFNHDVTAVILSDGTGSTALKDAKNAAILCCMGVPGYWLSVMFLERLGRKNIQLYGFLIIGTLYLICGLGREWFLGGAVLGHTQMRQYLFLVLYGLTFLFSNFGPNTTTFVIPGEIFPSEVRATCHGVSAASGKAGAAFGAYFFPLLLGPGGTAHPTKEGMLTCMVMCGVIAYLGALATMLLTPSYNGDSLARDEGSGYLLLDYSCLHPSMEEMSLFGNTNKEMSYTMVQTVEGSHNYSMTSGKTGKMDTRNSLDLDTME